MEKKKNKTNTLIILLSLLASFSYGIFLGITLVEKLSEDNLVAKYLLMFSILIFAFFIVRTINACMHELGHLVFGLLTGYKFVSYRILSFAFVKEKDNKIHFKKIKIPGTLGQCLLDPPEFKDEYIPTFLYNMGGVFFNCFFMIIEIILFILFIDYKWLSLIILFFVTSNFMIIVSNGIPNQNELISNDGYNAKIVHKNKEVQKSLYSQLKIYNCIANNTPYEEIPSEYFYLPNLKDMNNPITSTTGVNYINYLINTNRYEEGIKIAKLLINCKEINLNGTSRILLLAELICYDCLNNNNAEALLKMEDNLYKKYAKKLFTNPTIARTNYAIELFVNNDKEKAKKAKILFYQSLKKYPFKAETQVEEKLFNMIDIKYNKQNIKEEA